MNRRHFLKAALALPMGAWMSRYNLLAEPARNQIKITDIKNIVLKNQWKSLVKVETDAGIPDMVNPALRAKSSAAGCGMVTNLSWAN